MSDFAIDVTGSGDLAVSVFSSPALTAAPTPVTALTAQWIIDNFLPGLPLETSLGQPMSPALINGRIKSVVATFQRRYGVRLAPTTIKCGSLPMRGDPIDVQEQFVGFDYHHDGNMDNRLHSMRVPVGPIREILGLGLHMPGMRDPAVLPVDWAVARPRSNLVRLFPRQSLTAAVAFIGGYFMNIHLVGRTMPDAWHITYIAGYTPEDLNGPEYDVLQALGKMVAIELLVPGSMDSLLAEGLAGKGISVDGLSQNITLLQNPNSLKYTNLLTRMGEELAAWEATYWARRSGVRMSIL